MTLNILKIKLINQLATLKNNIFLALYLILGVILFCLCLAFYASVRVVWLPNSDSQAVSGSSKAISLRIEDYEFSVKRIKSGVNYIPPAPLFQNPFKNQ